MTSLAHVCCIRMITGFTSGDHTIMTAHTSTNYFIMVQRRYKR